MRQFQHVATNELPVLYEDFDLSAEARAIMEGYVGELQDWLAGILNWHRQVPRYRSDHLARRAHGFLPDRTPAPPLLRGPEPVGLCAPPSSLARRGVGGPCGISRAGGSLR
jgi:germacradienol/geosmin synthase